MYSSPSVFLESVYFVNRILEICVLFSNILKFIFLDLNYMYFCFSLYFMYFISIFVHDKWFMWNVHCKALKVRNGFLITSNLKTISVSILYYVFLAFDTFLLLNLFAIKLLHAWTLAGLILLYFIVSRRWLFLEIYEWKWF